MIGNRWGKLPYPKFLESHNFMIWARGDVICYSSCFFGYRVNVKREDDGVAQDVAARATTDDAGFLHMLDGLDLAELDFRLRGTDGEYRSFLVEELRVVDNPDGSFNHLSFGLLDMARDGRPKTAALRVAV